jgi:hypothetical protein
MERIAVMVNSDSESVCSAVTTNPGRNLEHLRSFLNLDMLMFGSSVLLVPEWQA